MGVKRIKQSKDAHPHYQAFYKTLIESSQDMIFVIALGGVVDFVNSVACDVLGCKAKNVIGKRMTSLFPRHVSLRQSKNLKTVFATGKTHAYQEKSYLSGKDIWLDTTLSPINDSDGKVVAVMGVSRDITELKRKEQELNKFKLGLDKSNDAIIMTDITGKIQYVNESFYRIYSYSEKEVIGNNPRMWKSDYYDLKFYKNFWKTILSGHSITVEFKNKTKQGNYIYMLSTVSPIIGSDKKILGFLASQRDVTEKRQIETMLEESQKNYRDIVENSPNMIHSVDINGYIVFSNRKESEVLGYTNEELIGMYMCKLYGQSLCKQVKAGFAELKKKGTLVIPNGTLFKKNGEKLTGEIHSVAVYDDNGKFLRTRSIIHDITERTKVENEFKKKVEQMELVARFNLKRHKEMMRLEQEVARLKKQIQEHTSCKNNF